MITALLLLVFFGGVLLIAAVVSVAVLGLGSLLALVFRVTVFEATIVVLAAAITAVWFLMKLGPVPETKSEEPEQEEEPHFIITPLPPLMGRRGKKRPR